MISWVNSDTPHENRQATQKWDLECIHSSFTRSVLDIFFEFSKRKDITDEERYL